MFNWLYVRIGKAVVGEFEAWMQDPENIKELTKMTDALVDRQMQRLYGSLGGVQQPKSLQPGGKMDISSLITSRGGLSGKKILGYFLQNFLAGKQKGQKQGALP